MYTLVTAVLRKKGINETWEEVDISQEKVSSVFSNYVSGYIVLTNPMLAGEQLVDYHTLKQLNLPLGTGDFTFTVWLGSFPNTLLPVLTKEPTYTHGSAVYADAYRAGYKIEPHHPSASSNDNYTKAQLTDGYMTKTLTSASDLEDYALIVVNGFLHLHTAFKEGARVRDMMKTMWRAGDNNVGVISFAKIGKLKLIPLTKNLIGKQTEDINLVHEAIVNTGIDLNHKHVMASIGGYLVNGDAVRTINADNGLVRLSLSRFDLPRRIFNSRDTIDLSSLKLTPSQLDPRIISHEELRSDEVILEYLTLSQSFLIIVDTDAVVTEKRKVPFTGIHGTYEYKGNPKEVLMDSKGRISHYWPVELENDDLHVVCDDDFDHFELRSTMGWRDLRGFSEERDVYGDDPHAMFFLEISGFKQR